MLRRIALSSPVVMLSLLGLVACDVRTIPSVDASPGDAGREAPDTGPGLPDAGPRPDAGPNFNDVVIWAHSPDTLFRFSPFTNTVTEVGVFELADGTPGEEMNDLAVDAAGNVFVGSRTQLWQVDTETAVITEIGDFGLDGGDRLFALSFLTPDQSPDGTETLIGATNAGVYFAIDLTDASTTRLGQYPEGWRSSGDIVSVEGLGTFATLARDDFGADVLARISFAGDGSSSVDMLGPVRGGGVDYTQIFGLGYWGRDVYGFTNDGQLIKIDRTNGSAELVSDQTGAEQFWGAGVTTEVPFLI